MRVNWLNVNWFIDCLGTSDGPIWLVEAALMAHGTPGHGADSLPGRPSVGQGRAGRALNGPHPERPGHSW